MTKKCSLIIWFSQNQLGVYLVNGKGDIVSSSFHTLLNRANIEAHPDWIEFNPQDLLYEVQRGMLAVMAHSGLTSEGIAGVGVIVEPTTSMAWNPKTGVAYTGIIGGACERTYSISRKWRSIDRLIRETAGGAFDYKSSAARYYWIIQHYFGGHCPTTDCVFGGVESWLIYHLSGQRRVVTDYSHAQSTGLLSIHTQDWDSDLAAEFNLSVDVLPNLVSHFNSTCFVHHFLPLQDGTPIVGCSTLAFSRVLGSDMLDYGDCFIDALPGVFTLHLNIGVERKPVDAGTSLLVSDLSAPVSVSNSGVVSGAGLVPGSISTRAYIDFMASQRVLVPHGRYLLVDFSPEDFRAHPLTWLDSNGLVAVSPPSLLADAAFGDTQTMVHFFNVRADHTPDQLRSSLLEMMAFSVKTQLQSFEGMLGVAAKRVCVNGDWAMVPEFMTCLADRLQVPVTTMASPAFMIQRFGLELLIRLGYLAGLSKPFLKSQVGGYWVPSMDPISCLASYTNWNQIRGMSQNT